MNVDTTKSVNSRNTNAAFRGLVFWVVTSAFLIALAYASVLAISYFNPNEENKHLTEAITKVANTAYHFFKPFLQLLFILIIMEWFLRRIGFKMELGSNLIGTENLLGNVQTIIGIIIIAGFTIAALSDIPGVHYLKDIALVVVGFYFGTQKRTPHQDNSKVISE